MKSYQEIHGDLISIARQGHLDVIVHGCNCHNTMGAGIAISMKQNFQTDKFPLENPQYKGDYNKLGQIDYKSFLVSTMSIYPSTYRGIQTQELKTLLTVVNLYSQFDFRIKDNKIPLDYDALKLGLRKINHLFKGKTIGLPLIGCGLAGGLWSMDSVKENEKNIYANFEFVQDIIKNELKDMHVVIVFYDKIKNETPNFK